MKSGVLIVCLALAVAPPSIASFKNTEAELEDIDARIQKMCWDGSETDGLCARMCRGNRLRSFEPNYAVWQCTQEDDHSLEVHYSLRYLVTRPDCLVEYRNKRTKEVGQDCEECLKNYRTRYEIFFTYTGTFDFYWFDQRDSDPVVNRTSNPALHWRQYLGRSPDRCGVEYFDLAIQHRSNGQVSEAADTLSAPESPDDGRPLTQLAYEARDLRYFDGLSRGANYLSAEVKLEKVPFLWRFLRLNPRNSMWVSGKAYLDHDSSITWGSPPDSTATINDFDRWRIVFVSEFVVGREYVKSVALGAEYTFGDRWVKKDSINLHLFLPVDINIVRAIRIPLFIRYHGGPMATLSNYTRDQWSLGIGCRFR